MIEKSFRPRRWLTLMTVACLVVAVAGCGTRVQLAGSRATTGYGPSSGNSPGQGSFGSSGGTGPSGQVVGGASPASGRSGSASGGGASGSSFTGGGTGASSGGPQVSGAISAGSGGSGGGTVAPGGAGSPRVLGLTPTTIDIGYTYSDTATFKAFAAECSACASFGDETFFPSLFGVLADDLNSKGGIDHHKVVFHGYAYNSTSAATDTSQLDSIVQAACQNFTQQTPVFAVVSALGSTLSPCLTRSGVSTVAPTGGIGDTIDQRTLQSSLLYEPGVSMTDPYEPVYVKRLAAQGYFSGWNTTTGSPSPAPAKIGLVSFSDPEFAATDRILAQALTAAGYKIADHIWYSAELDTQSQSVQNAILQFRSEGVTHVMGTGANGLFMYESVNQGYYPRYAYQTGSVSDTTADSQTGFRGSIAEGIFPVADIDPSQNPPSVGPLQTRCEQMATKAGVSWQSNQSFHADLLTICDSVWDMADALARSGVLTPQGLASGFDELGTIPSAVTFSETWGPTRHASADTMEDFRYDTGCSCFKYTGPRTRF